MKIRKLVKCAAIVCMVTAALLLGGCGSSPVGAGIVHEGSTYTQSVSEGDYAYSTLDEETREVYNQIVYAIEKRKSEVRLATTDVSVMEQAYQAVRYDHCEYFWFEKFSYVTHQSCDAVKAIYFSPEFSMTGKEQLKTQAEIDTAVESLLADAPADGSDYEKVLYVYRTMIESVDYNLEASDSQNIISAFLDGETVCQGYAYGTQYLLEELGVSCTTVEGTAAGANHAWNLIVMDGDYYYLDTTWGNSQYLTAIDQEETGTAKYIDYNYFGVTTGEIEETHTISDGITLPDCTATQDNYFIHEGVYFDKWDADAIGARMRQAYENAEAGIELKFSNMDLFEQMLQHFIADGHITDYCADMSTVSYVEMDKTCTLLLLFD